MVKIIVEEVVSGDSPPHNKQGALTSGQSVRLSILFLYSILYISSSKGSARQVGPLDYVQIVN